MTENAKSATSAEASGQSKVPPTRATGAESATGAAIAAKDDKIPQGTDRGSQVEIQGGAPEPDALEGATPKGDQAKPAEFSSNGQLPNGMVGSPSGPVPVGAVARDQKHADELLKETKSQRDQVINRNPKGKRLTDATINRLSGAELRAIAGQRGYDIPEAGTRMTRAAFARAQDADNNVVLDDADVTQ
jgi:hypothetical protein